MFKFKLFLLILLVPIVYAQDINYGNPDIYDSDSESFIEDIYDNPDAYLYPEFYVQSDPEMWDMELVDWTQEAAYNKEVFAIPEAYQQNDFYIHMRFYDYDELDYKLVDYDNPNLNHKNIDKDKYMADLGCEECKLTIYQDVKYTKDKIIHQNGEFASMPGPYPKGTKIISGQIGIFVEFPKEVTKIDFEVTDELTIVVGRDHDLEYKGHSFEHGTISFKDKQPYIKGFQDAVIDGINIENTYGSDEKQEMVKIFFDKDSCEGDCIAINKEKNKVFFSRGINGNSGYSVEFEKGNPFMDVEEEDLFKFQLGYNNKLQIQKRENQIPLITLTRGGHGIDIQMINGGKTSFIIDDNDLIEMQNNDMSFGRTFEEGSVPFAMIIQNQEGQNELGTERIVFDNSKNYIILPEKFTEEKIECVECSVNFAENKDLFDYVLIQVNKPGFKDLKINADDSLVLYKASEMLKKLPPKLRVSFREISIFPIEKVREECDWEKSAGCARGSSIVVGDELYYNILYHEAVHTRTYEIENEVTEEYDAWVEYKFQLIRKYGERIYYDADIMTPEEDAELDRLVFERKEKEKYSFANRWRTIAGDVYGKNLAEPDSEERDLSTKWDDGKTEPRNGCVRAYGCNNFYEDVATFVEPIAKEDYRFYKDLIAQDERYKKKLDLLLEFELITQEDYDKVMASI